MAAEFPGWALAERKKIKDALSDGSFTEKLSRFQETTSDAQFVIEWASFAEHADECVRANIQWATEKWAGAVFAAISAFCADSDCKEALHEAVNRVSLVAAKSDDTPTRQRHSFALDKDQKSLVVTLNMFYFALAPALEDDLNAFLTSSLSSDNRQCHAVVGATEAEKQEARRVKVIVLTDTFAVSGAIDRDDFECFQPPQNAWSASSSHRRGLGNALQIYKAATTAVKLPNVKGATIAQMAVMTHCIRAVIAQGVANGDPALH